MLLSSMVFPDIKLEEKLWKSGYINVVGVDEAGRGPLAGPVVAGAVLIHNINQVVDGVRDSKKMTKKARELAYDEIKLNSSSYGIGIVDSSEIDRIGIQKAVLKAMEIAINEILTTYKVNYIIADGKNVSLIDGYNMDRITKGDMYHYSISAGSVLAKVTRDRIMENYSLKYPQYEFDKHMGYGTKKHIEFIQKYGICDIHRKSFEPIKSYLLKGIKVI